MELHSRCAMYADSADVDEGLKMEESEITRT